MVKRDIKSKKSIFIFSTIIIVAILVAVIVFLTVFYSLRNDTTESDGNVLLRSDGAIVANGLECAAIGSSILKKNGSVADAAIATLFCEGVACPQSMGLGGGFVLTIYTRSTKTVETLMARETAPLAATENMFEDNPNESIYGGKASGVPGELKGYWSLHQKYGKLPWSTLIQPTIDLCKKGHKVSAYLSRILILKQNDIYENPSLNEIFINPLTNKTWKEGDVIKRIKLAETLQVIAIEGENALYNGSLTENFIKDIQNYNGIITKEDLLQYKVRWEEPVTTLLENDYNLYTTPLPTSGVILVFILNILKGYLPIDRSINSYHRFVESLKFGYGYRTRLGDKYFITPSIEPLVKNLTDPKFADYIRSIILDEKTFTDYAHYGAKTTVTEDHGTAHISIIGTNGDAIAVTSTINNILGSKRRSQSTGIILNDEMDDFTYPTAKTNGLPPNPANFIKPGKRPLSAMVPTIITDKNGDVQLVIGGAGGLKILSSVAFVIFEHLYHNQTIKDSFIAKRLHHQLQPMTLEHEKDFDSKYIDGLIQRGHFLKEAAADAGFAALTAISKENGHFKPIYDWRRGGSVDILTK